MNKRDNQFKREMYVTSNKNVIVGIDIGSRFHYFQYQTSDMRSKAFKINNNEQGFQKFKSHIEKLGVAPEKVIVGIEPTGPYWKALTGYLEKCKYEWVFVSPSHTYKYAFIQHNSPLKRDDTDTSVIISLVKGGHYLHHPKRDKHYQELYNLSRFRHQLIHNRTVVYNHLHAILSEYFPELLQIFPTINSRTLCRLLKNYPTPETILEHEYLEIFQTLSYKINKKWLEKKVSLIIEAAKHSIGIKDGILSYKIHISNLVSQISLLNKQIKEIEEKIKDILEEIQEAKLLKTIRGMSNNSIAILLGYFGDISHYNNVQEAIKYAGLNLYERSSGSKQGEKHISKKGPSILRHTLFLVSLNLIRKNEYVKDKYLRYVKNKKNKLKAVIPIMHYIIRVMFSMIKNQTEFIPNYQNYQGNAA